MKATLPLSNKIDSSVIHHDIEIASYNCTLYQLELTPLSLFHFVIIHLNRILQL
uniref:Uncharacterized protein n=1 Tax=Anguilla anguilla TaxID=7936 RepID=A0A0E9PTU9_ANGAN